VAEISKRRSLVLLFCLYFAQGLPFGFQNEISAFLRQAGLSLTKIGFANLLTMPWSVKALWAPLVERYGSERFGRRKTWIVAMQLLLAATCVVTALFPPSAGLQVLAGRIAQELGHTLVAPVVARAVVRAVANTARPVRRAGVVRAPLAVALRSRRIGSFTSTSTVLRSCRRARL